jgi:hypothetical protein
MADTLSLWQASADEALTAGYLNIGNVARASTADLVFRVHNESLVYTARDILISVVSTSTIAVPDQQYMFYLSDDGLNYTATLTVDSVPPIGTSQVITLRRITSSTAQLGTFTFRVEAKAGSWI